MKGRILYYAVGPVHPKNLQLIAEQLPDWTFTMVYESNVWWMDKKALEAIPFTKIPLSNKNLAKDFGGGDYDAVIFSSLQPRKEPLDLLRWASNKRIPAIAIEESNQFALNHGAINNYILPVDHLLVASPFERRFLTEREGIDPGLVEATGWPFYAGPKSSDARQKAESKLALGLDPKRPVISLTLTAFNDAGETESVRRRQLEMAASSLGEDCQLVVKPHPIEKMEVINRFVAKYAPMASTLEGAVPVNDMLNATDILLNRGVSQVSLEAIMRRIPVIVIDCGDKTPFHDFVPKIIAVDESSIKSILRRLQADQDPLQLYQEFCKEHIPYPPTESIIRTCRRIEEIAERGKKDHLSISYYLVMALFYAWKIGRGEGLDILQEAPGDRGVSALRKLMSLQATQGDMEILQQEITGYYRLQVLRCLWLDQVDANSTMVVGAEDIEWMSHFPSRTNSHLFFSHCEIWFKVLLKRGYREIAESFLTHLDQSFANDEIMGRRLRDMRLYSGGIRDKGEYLLRFLYRKSQSKLGRVKAKIRQK
jgi:hypothetical protein